MESAPQIDPTRDHLTTLNIGLFERQQGSRLDAERVQSWAPNHIQEIEKMQSDRNHFLDSPKPLPGVGRRGG